MNSCSIFTADCPSRWSPKYFLFPVLFIGLIFCQQAVSPPYSCLTLLRVFLLLFCPSLLQVFIKTSQQTRWNWVLCFIAGGFLFAWNATFYNYLLSKCLFIFQDSNWGQLLYKNFPRIPNLSLLWNRINHWLLFFLWGVV